LKEQARLAAKGARDKDKEEGLKEGSKEGLERV